MYIDTTTNVRSMHEGDLDDVLAWRNHADVRRWMYQQAEISRDVHEAWFARCSTDPSQRLLIVEEADAPLGFVRFSGICDGEAEWGFYKVPAAPPGSGMRMGFAALVHGFQRLGLERITACVLEGNQRSIHFHRKLGFRQLASAAATAGTEHFLLERSQWLTGDNS